MNPSRPSPSEPVRAVGSAPPVDGTPPGPRADAVRTITRTAAGVVTSDGIEAIPDLPLADGGIVWVDAAGASADEIGRVARRLGLHELIVEDILEGNQRAKIEVTDDLVHVVMFSLRYDDPIAAVEIDIVLGDGFLLTSHGPDWDPLASHHLRGEGLAAVFARGADHLLWSICDDLVDGYFPLLDKLGDEIDLLEDAVIEHGTVQTLERLFDIKRDLIMIRRAAAPVREIFNQLTNRDLALIDADEIIYFRDVYDHLIRLTDELDTYRELVSGTLDVYLSTVNNNLSLIMKRLTGVTVVLAGVAAFGGIFGMSEAGAAFAGTEATGFWLVTAGIFAIAFFMAYVLRRLRWI
jgi:magnesium transporter